MASNPDTWSSWFNINHPDFPQATGDTETTENILKSYKICDKGYDVISSQCQVSETGYVFDETTPRNLTPNVLQMYCTKDGVSCRNVDQPSGTVCKDYAIRYRCKYSGSGSSSDSGFPQFDVRIYIILAVVPIVIFLARLLWTYVFKQRRERRRAERRARRREQDGQDPSLGLAKPPPSYHDLFGEPGHIKASVFTISRNNIPICSKCSSEPCSVAVVIKTGGDGMCSTEMLRRDGPPTSQSEVKISSPQPHRVIVTSSSQHSPNTTPVASPSRSVSDPMPSSSALCEVDLSEVPREDSVTSYTVHLEMEQPAQADHPSTSPSPSVAKPPCISQPCPCVCHRTVPFTHHGGGGYDNASFSYDLETQPHLPGMHMQVPGLHRAWSTLSTTSVITLSELPSYEDALELMKKRLKESEANSEGVQETTLSQN
ncbi:uncharacterized protein LOC131950888 isoform X2 [Physella acuta]|nr:uncharacterized protein LOC131950888 isoform X2 [Physella acuta]XP_059169073.1 uncharacterized protein LOC131950888 isoform X2 [Physella acuta]